MGALRRQQETFTTLIPGANHRYPPCNNPSPLFLVSRHRVTDRKFTYHGDNPFSARASDNLTLWTSIETVRFRYQSVHAYITHKTDAGPAFMASHEYPFNAFTFN